jgi:D-proline reductase (dithiol) PrdB
MTQKARRENWNDQCSDKLENQVTEIYDVPYMERTRDYYRAQGYSTDYQWAQHATTPFTALSRPLNECRLAVITTAMPDTEIGRAQRHLHSTLSVPIPKSMYTEELSWDKNATHTKDVASFLPLEQLLILEEEGTIGSIAPRFHSVATDYSQRNTRELDAPEILERCREDQIDVALLVPL